MWIILFGIMYKSYVILSYAWAFTWTPKNQTKINSKICILLEMWVSIRVWDLPETRLGAKVPKMFAYIRYICVFWIYFWYTYIFEFLVWISGYSFGFRVKIQILKIYFWVFRYNFGYSLVLWVRFQIKF